MKQKTNETFSYKVKAEAIKDITGRKKSDACLMGLLLCSETGEDHIRFDSDCDICSELFLRLVSHAAENENAVKAEVIRSRGRAPRFRCVVDGSGDIAALTKRLGFAPDDFEGLSRAADKLSEKNFSAFTAGVFMGCGSITSPDKEYHMEFSFPEKFKGDRFGKLLESRIGVSLKYIERAGEHILYLKDSESIEDVLTLIGASMSSLEIMNVKVYKDIRNRANRATNCDTANCERQNRSASRQIKAIRIIESSEGGLSVLSDDLIEVALKRIEHPDYNLNELSKEFDPPLSKSGINHRLRRIEEIASDIENKKG